MTNLPVPIENTHPIWEALGNSGNVTWGSLDALRQISKLGISQEDIVEETKEIQ